METSNLYKLNIRDVIRSLATSAFVAVVAVLYGLTAQSGFDVFATDWAEILKTVINSVIITFVARMGEKFVTDTQGTIHIGGMKIEK